MLSRSQADGILERALTPRIAPAGFNFVGRSTWARTGKPHICELVRFRHTKGAATTPIWGVALDFVPEVAGSRLRWTRHPDSLYFDLEWSPLDYDDSVRTTSAVNHEAFMGAIHRGIPLTFSAEREPRIERWYVSLLDSLEIFEARSAALAALTAREAVAFLDGISGLDQVREKLAFQRTYPYQGLGFFNHVQPPLAYAFLLARLGRAGEAMEGYREYQVEIKSGQGVQSALDRAFAEARSHPFQ
jgi:hypothetical protein